MASKVVVIKSGNFDAQGSAEKLESELAALRGQLTEIAGVRTNDDGVEFPSNDFTVDPETKAKIVAHCKYLLPVFQADKKLSNTGRDPKADVTVLQRIYIDYVRANRTVKGEMLYMNVAIKYNEGRPEDQQIVATYVKNKAKHGDWNSLVDVPEPVTA